MIKKIKTFFIKDLTKSDDFIKRIRSLVIGEGMLNDGNIEMIDFAIKNMPSTGSVIEIGSYGGLSTNLIIHLLNKYQRTNVLVNCDAWIYEGYKDHLEKPNQYIDGRRDILRQDYSEYLKNGFINATKFLSPNRLPNSFHMFSDVFFEKWKQNDSARDIFGRSVTLGGPISFAYIDGGHSLDVAWTDFNNVTQFLIKGGFILLDDSADNLSFGSTQMMKTIKKDNRFKIVAKKPNYLLQKVSE